MHKYFRHSAVLAGAVAATLLASTASALSPAGPFAVSLTISGSSAFEAAVEGELARVGSSICNNPTAGTVSYDKFISSSGDFRAYTCNLAPNVVSVGGGEAAVIYYRGEGGSVVGVAPLLTSRAITPKRLALSNCAQVDPGLGATATCTIGAYSLAAENPAVAITGLENGTSQLGFADVEPNMFTGENYPSASAIPFLQPALSASERATLNSNASALVGQAFGVYVNTSNAELAAVPSLSRTVIANIFQGVYGDWSLVPTANGGTVTTDPLPIKLCRREQGSGTQIAASLFFNDYFNSATPFASEGNQGALLVANGGGGVLENASTGAVRTCLNSNTAVSGGAAAGAIGVISSEADTAGGAGHHQIQIDGQGTPIGETANNLGNATATGQYAFWYEVVGIKRSGLSGGVSTLADKVLSVTRTRTTGPSTPNVVFLSPFNASQYPLAGGTQQPVSCLRKNKNSVGPAIWGC